MYSGAIYTGRHSLEWESVLRLLDPADCDMFNSLDTEIKSLKYGEKSS